MAWAGALLAAAAVLFWCYLRESRTAPVNSDGSVMALQGWDMLHGNLLLSGWWLADVTFYAFEIPVDALVEAVRGLNADVVHTSAAVVYTLLVLTAALLARGRARGGEGVVRALIAAGIMLAPAYTPGARVLILSPDHTGVGVPILLTLLLVDRMGGRRWAPAAVCALLVWAQVDDPLATVAAAAPLAVVCLMRAVLPRAVLPGLRRRRVARPGARPGAWSGARSGARSGAWPDVRLAVAAAASVGLAHLAVSAIGWAGGYSMQPLGSTGTLTPPSAWPGQLRATGQNVLILFGADFFDQPPGIQTAIAYVHFAGLVLALCGLLAGIAGLVRGADRVTQTLTAGTLVTLGGGAFALQMTVVAGAHEIAVALPFGAVLAGRTLGPWLADRSLADRRPASRRLVARRRLRIALSPLLGVCLAGYLAVLGYNASLPAMPSQTQDIADWLVAHHLTDGLGRYWGASSTTLASGGRVLVIPTENAGKVANPWVTKPSWYDPRVYDANFVIAAPGAGNALAFGQAAVQQVFGPPADVYPVGQYVIMVWDKNLLLQVDKPVQG
jgi:hypothetical protein